jgi:hypothetical protein
MLPSFFSKVAEETSKRWDQLESDPELAAPWWQLFKQVQSPRHVLSELLQNAEDAGATWANTTIRDGYFVFEYDGSDFDEPSFRSLCRFGYSNKRSLHTIGFRGIGFKTTFSLGHVVRVETPSFGFEFEASRFTAPKAIATTTSGNFTRISVRLDSGDKEQALRDNFKEWLASPLPLIFFDNLSKLTILGTDIEKLVDRVGPVVGSEWVFLSTSPNDMLLRIKSKEQPFPKNCVEEVRQERGDPEFAPAPCIVEIVLGARDSRLYTVLPTHVNPPLPFCSNAPFLQDPSRYRIKAPEVSSTNKWLLRRIGALACHTMTAWLANTKLAAETRAKAYELLPLPKLLGSSADNAICKVVVDAFEPFVDQEVLLDFQGWLLKDGQVVDVPRACLEFWKPGTAVEVLGATGSAIHPGVEDSARDRLNQWGLIERFDWQTLCQRLSTRQTLPRPPKDEDLIKLWAFVYQADQKRIDRFSRRSYPIVPVRGTPRLIHARQAAFILERDATLSGEDHELLLKFLDVVDMSFIQQLDKLVEDHPDFVELQSAKAMKPTERPTSMQEALEFATRKAFEEGVSDDDRIRLTQFAARHNLIIERERMPAFRFLTRNGSWEQTSNVVHPRPQDEGDLFPDIWLDAHAVSDQYVDHLAPDAVKVFWDWACSEKGNVRRFPSPIMSRHKYWSESNLNGQLKDRGVTLRWAKQASAYILDDYDWELELRRHWGELASKDEEVWSRLVEAFGNSFGPDITKCIEARGARLYGAVPRDFQGGIPAIWLHRLRNQRCLIEERTGLPEVPALLLRRTPQTEPLLQIERFVHRSVDGYEMVPLLDALGVRKEPQNAHAVLERLRALAKSNEPPLTRLLDLYRAVDSIASACDHEKQAEIRSVFAEQALIFSQDGQWRRSNEIFQANDEGFDGLATIHPELRGLRLWEIVHVPRFASVEVLLGWLEGLVPFEQLSDRDRKQAQAVLAQWPADISTRFDSWLSCQGQWMPLDELKFYTTDVAATTGLFKQFKSAIADFSFLTPQVASDLAQGRPRIGEIVSFEIAASQSRNQAQPMWLRTIAISVARIRGVAGRSADELERERSSARMLHESSWIEAADIVVTPMIEGVQAGPDARKRSLWTDEAVIYVCGRPAQFHKELVDALLSRFSVREIRDAVRDCIGRDEAWAEERFASQFDLGPIPEDMQTSEAKNHKAPSNTSHKDWEVEIETVAVQADDEDQPDEGASEKESASDSETPGDQLPIEHRRRIRPLHLYLKEQGFDLDRDRGLYVNQATASVVRKEQGAHFPWVMYGRDGECQRRFLEVHHTLTTGIDIKAEVWLSLEATPESCWIVGPVDESQVFALSGTNLTKLKEGSWLSVAATTYRLRVQAEHERKLRT